jgi:FtsP/CotA-like multicopper oxidase with cupredoxin domain
MFHFLNASAIEIRHIALPGHKFNVTGLDGNPVPTPAAMDVLMLGPGERIDAWVEMNQPGVWIARRSGTRGRPGHRHRICKPARHPAVDAAGET